MTQSNPDAGTSAEVDAVFVENFRKNLNECEYLLVGLGAEWKKTRKIKNSKNTQKTDISDAYQSLYQLVEGKDYFIVTTVTDAEIFHTALDPARIVAPCGNETWQQCSEACTKDIWEPGEVPHCVCPHCGAPLIGNTIQAEHYIEEGYLPQWDAYKRWLSGTLNRRLLVLELGVNFSTPTVIRWPFEKTVFFNQKSHMYRINRTFYQISEEIRIRAVPVAANSVEFIEDLAKKIK